MKVRLLPRTWAAKLRRSQEERAEALRRHEDLQRYPRMSGPPQLNLRKFPRR